MARFYYQQNSFGSGVLTPKLYGRTDVEEYRKAVRKLDNFMIMPTGGVRKRPGIERFKEIATGGVEGESLHIPFQLSGSRGQVLLRIQYGTGVGGVSIVSDFLSDINLSGFGVAPNIIDAARLDPYGFVYTQIGSYVVIVHRSGTMKPCVLGETFIAGSLDTEFYLHMITDSTYSWGVDPIKFPWALSAPIKIPMDSPNTSNMTITASTATSGATGTITTNDPSGAVLYFTTDMIGEYILLDDKNATPLRSATYLITGTAGTPSSPSSTANVLCVSASAAFSLSATNYWYEQSWSNRKGWPKAVTTFENRLLYGGTVDNPSTIWASYTGVPSIMNSRLQPFPSDPLAIAYYRTFGETPDPSFPYTFTLSLGSSDQIEWLAAMDSLFVGTSEKEIQLNGGDSPISATNFPQVNVLSRYGARNVMPSYSGNQLYFVQRNGHDIVEIKYSSDNGRFGSQVVTDLSDMLIHEGNNEKNVSIVRLSTEPSDGINYMLTSDKKIYSFTSSSAFGSVGFARINIDSSITPFDLCFVPTGSYSRTDDYLAIFYTVNGRTSHDIMGLMGRDSIYQTIDTSNTDIPWCLDDYVILQNSSVDTVLILPTAYMEAKAVSVIDPDGEVLALTTPTGSTTLTIPAGYTANSYFVVGVPYTARLETLDLAVGPNFLYSSSGDEFRIDTVHFDLFRTYDLEYGTVSDGEEILYPLEVTTPPAVSGRFKVNLPMTSSNETRVVIQSSSPFNVTVSSLTMRGKNTQVS